MRNAVVALALTLAACGAPSAPEPAAPPEDAAAGSTGVGRIPEAPFELEQEALVGIWSFDRSCASGDGMRLNADGAASYDEWGEGTWTVDDQDRVVLTLARHEPGVGPTGETVIYNLTIAAPVTDDLIGQMATPSGEEPRGINARRCPE
jgi:hypothetical protein